MSPLRLLLIGLIVFLVLNYLFLKRKHKTSNTQNTTPATSQPMVCCAHCGVFFPKNDTYTHQEKHYCSLEHLQLGSKKQ